MVRNKLFDAAYFDRWIEFMQTKAINPRRETINSIPRPEGRIGRATDLCGDSVQLCCMRYSRGDAIPSLKDSVTQMVELLALKRTTLACVALEKDVRRMYERLDLATLYESLALLTFMVSLRLPAKDISQALEWIGHAGEDSVIDHVACAFGENARSIAHQSKFPKIYQPLVEVITKPIDQRATNLKKFVEGWYKSMKPIYWHNSHKGGEGAYFGYWCFEAALVAMVFDVDDADLIDHPHYPSDLVAHFKNPV